MGNELEALFSVSTRETAVADFYDGTIEGVLGTGVTVKEQLRACMENDEALYQVYA